MSPPPWPWFAWFRARPWLVRAVTAGLLVALTIGLFVTLAIWVAGSVAAILFLAVNFFIYLRGGWGLLGPHFYYDVIRLARRGRSTVLRVAYITAILVGLAIVSRNLSFHRHWGPNDFAHVSEQFTFTLFLVQNIAVVLLTPMYLGSAIAEEKERGTLELLFTTHLSNTEIVLGKLFSRVIHLIGLVLAGLPVLSLVQFWGGVDMLLIVGNLVNTVLNILSIGSVCLLASVLSRSVTGAVLTSYAVILPLLSCCGIALRWYPFVLQDDRIGGGANVTVQHLGVLCLVHLVIVTGFLSLAIAALRETEPLGEVMLPPRFAEEDLPRSKGTRRKSEAIQPATLYQAVLIASEPPRPVRVTEPENEFSIPYRLPPVTDDALLWKERYQGGPAWVLSPAVFMPAMTFGVTFLLAFGFWIFRSLYFDAENHQRAIEAWKVILRLCYYGCLIAYMLGVGFRSAATVARERQQGTLDALLLLPVERGEILRAKLWGCLWRGWPWLLLLVANISLGVLLGAYHPFTAVMLVIGPLPLIFFVAGLGLMLSVFLRTVLRANLVLLIVVMLLIASSFVLPFGESPITYIEALIVPPTQFRDMPAEVNRFVGGVIFFVGYAVIAALLLRFAFLWFDDRSHQGES